MSHDRARWETLAEICDAAGIELTPDEAALFLAAARVLLPAELGLEASLRGEAPPAEPLVAGLRALWARRGLPRRAPLPMPLQPLAPGVFGLAWRRVRTAVSQAVRAEPE